ncbi:hypothetical protein [Intestinimonas butyriciproducens]|uniref:hypothetical protein n=1 Tax=Intestinimonas butyriciproducens TaxID=1297617 RepID=UPI0034A51CF8
MRKRIVRIWDVPAGGLLPALITVASAFCIGGLAGMLLAAQVGGGGHDSLAAYIEGYLAAAKSGSVVLSPGLLSVLWESVRWPLFAFLMGFTALGVLGIPTLFAVRGFLLSFAVSSFVRMFGGTGGILAFFAFGITGLAAVPALFVLGVQSFAGARELAGRALSGKKGVFPFGRAYWVRCALCAGAVALSAVLEYWAVPALLCSAAGLF